MLVGRAGWLWEWGLKGWWGETHPTRGGVASWAKRLVAIRTPAYGLPDGAFRGGGMRWVFRGIGILVTLVVLAIAAVFLIPSERIAALAARQFEAATGRAITVTGAVRPAIWPQLGVTTGPIQIANAPWSEKGPMLSAQALAIGLDLQALLRGELVIRKVEALDPVIILETSAQGVGNWEFGEADGAASGAAEGGAGGGAAPGVQAFTMDQGLISNGSILYIDHISGRQTALSAINADIQIPTFRGPADIALSGEMNGKRIAVTATLGEFASFLAGKVGPVTAEVEAEGVGGTFEGRAGFAPLAAEGVLDGSVTDMAAAFALIGQATPGLPAGLGKSIGVAGKVTYTPQASVHLRDGVITLGGNVLNGAADLYLGEGKPRVVAQLSAGALAFSALAGAGGGAGGGGGDVGGWSGAALDVSGLAALDGEVTLTAREVDLGAAQLGPVDVVLRLEKARAVVELRKVAAYDGAITGELVVNGRKGLSVGGTLVARSVAMNPLLRDVAGYDRLIGSADGTLKFLGSGGSVAAIMQSLSGQGSVALGKGELRGLDLVGMIRNLDPGYVGAGQSTIFNSITGTFAIEGGVLRNSDLAFAAPLLTASGAGAVDLAGQSLNYRVTPVAMADADGTGGFRVPVIISGPWADPKVSLDLEGVVDLNFAKEKAKLEAEAKARLAEELGVVVQDGETLEEAARRALQEKAVAELAKALGGKPAVAEVPAVVAPVELVPAPEAPVVEEPVAPVEEAVVGEPAVEEPVEKTPQQLLLELLLKQGQGG